MIKQIMVLRYQDSTCLTNRLNYFQGIMNQLAMIGIKFDDYRNFPKGEIPKRKQWITMSEDLA